MELDLGGTTSRLGKITEQGSQRLRKELRELLVCILISFSYIA